MNFFKSLGKVPWTVRIDLLCAGWYPGRQVNFQNELFSAIPCPPIAKEIAEEFAGLTLWCGNESTVIDPIVGLRILDQTIWFSDLLNKKFFPLGHTDCPDDYFILADEDGVVYDLFYDIDDGVNLQDELFAVAANFQRALHRILYPVSSGPRALKELDELGLRGKKWTRIKDRVE
ncbi:MAG: SUKH-3 domain-containing protein [Planctomycetia bacterium]